MVSTNPQRLVEWISNLPLASRGAESEIRVGRWAGVDAVFKLRVSKPYMHPRLDYSLRNSRTRREAKLLSRALGLGASVPRLLAVFPSAGLIVMERIDGVILRDALLRGRYEGLHVREAGRILGLLHKGWIAHGDPTTSNYIVSRDGRVYLIDFGLAEQVSSLEDLAVDIHLFRRAVESTHASIADKVYRCFSTGYLSAAGDLGRDVLKRAEEIRLRGRYVEERRRTVWQ